VIADTTFLTHWLREKRTNVTGPARSFIARQRPNDTWIAGFCLYYRQPLVSLDAAFDRVPGLRRLTY
jgi:predicted nucleic acid-binding protein